MRPVSSSVTILCAIAALASPSASLLRAQSPREPLTIDRIFTRQEFTSAPLPAPQWLADGSAYLDLRTDDAGGQEIVRVDAATGAATVLAPASLLVGADGKPLAVESLVPSADGRRALLFHGSVRVWRQNTRGQYEVIDFAAKRVTPLSRAPGLQMFAKFSPDGRRVAFVRDNNLFVTDLATGAERALTSDGSATVINGTSDWVYEEELSIRDAFRWSPDSRRIAFWRFDQSPIPTYPLLDDMTLYPRVIPLRYPKAGEPNSKVTVGVVDVDGGATTWLALGSGPDAEYIAAVEWAGADSLTVQRMPRLQNRIDLLMASASSGKTRPILTERDSAWVDVDDAVPRWVMGGKAFLWPSERSGWRQYYLYRRDGTLVRRITRDGADVTALAGVDDARGLAYVIEASPTPMQRQLFAYRIAKEAAPTRITPEDGSHRVSLSPSGAAFVDFHSTAALPASAALVTLPSRARHPLEANEHLRALLQRDTRAPEFFQVPMPDGARLNAWRILPPSFDSTRRYPVLMYVYGGPGSQTVTDDYGGVRYLWHQMLAQKGYVVVSVDNRGTGARGSAFRHVVYRDLGANESRDQIDAARWLAHRSWVDSTRIGIWGWSYGGYMSSLTAFRGGSIFRSAISVAPVTSWRLYDDIYTERYMRTPSENPEGYRVSAPQAHVQGLTASFLVVHGTGDDNVHPQNTIQLIDRLEAAGKPFEMMLYPGRTHSISGGNTQAHLYATMTEFLDRTLGTAALGARRSALGTTTTAP